MKTTASKLSLSLGVNRPVAANLLNALAAVKKAEVVGKEEKAVGQRGRAAHVYDLTEETAAFLRVGE